MDEHMIVNNVDIIPTGDEIADGIVLDTDSPMIKQHLLELNSNCIVRIRTAVKDIEKEIIQIISNCINDEPDLIVLIGGSGSGHIHSNILGVDCTHSGMETYLDICCATSLYGKNGHMWSRLVCGKKGNALIINVPGPYVEAEAAIIAFCECISTTDSIHEINDAMSKAVLIQYGSSVGRVVVNNEN